jgi:hypothetical protein
MDNKEIKEIAKAAESIVGTLLVRGVVKPEDAERAHAIAAEELTVWFVIREHNKEWPFQKQAT